MTPAAEYLLRVVDLSKAYGGVRALDRVSFELNAGERVALIGPNGAGKSTCFGVINGQLAADAGSVYLFGRAVRGLRPPGLWRLGVGRTFQITATFGSMTVLENVQLALLVYQRRHLAIGRGIRRRGRAEALALLEQVGLADQAGRAAAVLAYGDLKRLELALALTNQPRLLLLDEPTAGMAPAERGALMQLTSTLAAEQRIGVLFTEHDMEVVFAHAERVLVLHRGVLIAAGTPGQVRRDRQVRAVYLGTAGDGGVP